MSEKTITLRCPRCENDFTAEICVDEKCPNCHAAFDWTECAFADEDDLVYHWMPNWF